MKKIKFSPTTTFKINWHSPGVLSSRLIEINDGLEKFEAPAFYIQLSDTPHIANVFRADDDLFAGAGIHTMHMDMVREKIFITEGNNFTTAIVGIGSVTILDIGGIDKGCLRKGPSWSKKGDVWEVFLVNDERLKNCVFFRTDNEELIGKVLDSNMPCDTLTPATP